MVDTVSVVMSVCICIYVVFVLCFRAGVYARNGAHDLHEVSIHGPTGEGNCRAPGPKHLVLGLVGRPRRSRDRKIGFTKTGYMEEAKTRTLY